MRAVCLLRAAGIVTLKGEKSDPPITNLNCFAEGNIDI